MASWDIQTNVPLLKDSLAPLEHSILNFERLAWKYSGAKEAAIREQFGLSATHYYQLLNALLDRPEAYQFDPMTVGRLRSKRLTRTKR